jgi:tetratricopeptide (TPR) repeat protein
MARQPLSLSETLKAAFFLLPFLIAPLTAVTVDELVRDGLAAEARLDAPRALELFQAADAARPNDAFILQKIAKQYSDQVPDQTTDGAKREFATRALGFAERSVALEPTNAVYVLSLAICHGHLALVSDIRTKVEYSRLIKDESERALRLDPDYAWAHHLLGRWHYEVASFGSVARFFAKLLYGGIPPASREAAVAHLRRATELEPGELNHWIELGFAYAASGRKDEARRAWQHGLAMPDASKHDQGAKARAREALADLD